LIKLFFYLYNKNVCKYNEIDKKKVKTTHFGASGYEHYSGGHGDVTRKMNHIKMHKDKEDWNDYMSSGSLVYYILWNKQILTTSIEDYMRKFKLKKY
jgi:hypothetical protein